MKVLSKRANEMTCTGLFIHSKRGTEALDHTSLSTSDQLFLHVDKKF